MHNTLNNLPKAVVPDANVLLDATFVNGFARKSILKLRSLGYTPIVDHNIRREALSTVTKIADELNLRFDPVPLVSQFVSANVSSVELTADQSAAITSVKKHDKHVAKAALHHRAWILTGDVELITQSARAGIPARLPWDVVLEAAQNNNPRPEEWQFVRCAGLGSKQGSIFCRFSSPSWPSKKDKEQKVIFEVGDLCRLFYEPRDTRFVFALSNGQAASVEWELSDGQFVAVAGSYSIPERGRNGSIRVLVGEFDRTPRTAKTGTLQSSLSGTLRNNSLFRDLTGGAGWASVTMRALVISPVAISPKHWKNLMAIPEGAPNPYDKDALRIALNVVDTMNAGKGTLVFPTERELAHYGMGTS